MINFYVSCVVFEGSSIRLEYSPFLDVPSFLRKVQLVQHTPVNGGLPLYQVLYGDVTLGLCLDRDDVVELVSHAAFL